MAVDQSTAIDLAREVEFSLGGLRVKPASREVLVGGRIDVLEPRVNCGLHEVHGLTANFQVRLPFRESAFQV